MTSENSNKTGPFQLQPSDISYRDVSTVRRMLGGVNEAYVIAAWNSRSTVGRLLVTSSSIVDKALSVAASK